jgi:predicted nucleic acid-binding protein
MKFVLDASVAVKWVLPEADTPRALALRDDFRRLIHELVAPDIFPVEVAHALTRAERSGLLRAQEANAKLNDALLTAPDLHPYLPLLRREVEISSHQRLGVYDCLYVALAEREQCELLTADARLASIGFPFVVLLSNLP